MERATDAAKLGRDSRYTGRITIQVHLALIHLISTHLITHRLRPVLFLRHRNRFRPKLGYPTVLPIENGHIMMYAQTPTIRQIERIGAEVRVEMTDRHIASMWVKGGRLIRAASCNVLDTGNTYKSTDAQR